MYKSLLHFMVISLKKTIPFVLKAKAIVKLSSTITSDGIINRLTILSQANFYTRAVLLIIFKVTLLHSNTYYTIIRFKRSCIFNPNDTVKHIYLI